MALRLDMPPCLGDAALHVFESVHIRTTTATALCSQLPVGTGGHARNRAGEVALTRCGGWAVTINELIDQLQLLKTVMQVPGDTGNAVFAEGGEEPELLINSVEVEGRARRYVAINCNEA